MIHWRRPQPATEVYSAPPPPTLVITFREGTGVGHRHQAGASYASVSLSAAWLNVPPTSPFVSLGTEVTGCFWPVYTMASCWASLLSQEAQQPGFISCISKMKPQETKASHKKAAVRNDWERGTYQGTWSTLYISEKWKNCSEVFWSIFKEYTYILLHTKIYAQLYIHIEVGKQKSITQSGISKQKALSFHTYFVNISHIATWLNHMICDLHEAFWNSLCPSRLDSGCCQRCGINTCSPRSTSCGTTRDASYF